MSDIFDGEIAKSWTLPSQVYTGPEIYSRVVEDIFAKSWQFIGHEEMVKVPGAVQPFLFLEGSVNEPVVLTRGMDDQIRLLSNVCTHRGMLVAETAANERYLRCRYHGRRFGLDGCFQAMPDFEGVECFPSKRDDLPGCSLEKWGPFLFGHLADDAPSLSNTFAPMMDRLAFLPLGEFRYDANTSRDYLVKANWALYSDNYLEGFHIPFIHKGLAQVIDSESYDYELFPTGNLQLAEAQAGEPCFDLPDSSPDKGKRIAAYYYWFFPNLMFNFYPWGLSINVVKPLGASLTRVSFIRYVWKPDLVGIGAGGDLDRVEREDEAVVEAVQLGVRSRKYDRGRFSPTKEVGTHHFHQLLGDALGIR